MHDKVIGVWCTTAYGCSPGQGHHYLTFRTDRTGRYDLQCLCGHDFFEYESTTFRWGHPRAHHLTIVGVQFFRYRLQGSLHDLQGSDVFFEDVPYEIDLETNDRGRTGPAFRANLWIPWENAFGLCTRDYSSLVHEDWLAAIGAPR